MIKHCLFACIILAGITLSAPRGLAFQVSSPIHADCHERMSFHALEQMESKPGFPAQVEPDDEFLADKLQFDPLPYGIDRLTLSLIIGARYNDLHGASVLEIDTLVPVHNQPEFQNEHCLRQAFQDGEDGARGALLDCRDFIAQMVERACGDSDHPDPWLLEEVEVFLRFRGPAPVPLSRLYFNLGRALHTVQDSFSHTLRSTETNNIIEIFNWIEVLEQTHEAGRDGFAHQALMDDCNCKSEHFSPLLADARQASVDFLDAVFSAADAQDRNRRLNAFFEQWMSFQAGCNLENNYCDHPLLDEIEGDDFRCSAASSCGCEASKASTNRTWVSIFLLLPLVYWFLKRKRSFPLLLLLLSLGLGASPALAADKPELCPSLRPDTGAHLHFRSGASVDRPALSFELGALYRWESWGLGLYLDFNPFMSFERGFEIKAGAMNLAPGVSWHIQVNDKLSISIEGRIGLSMLLFNSYDFSFGSVGLFLGLHTCTFEYRLTHNLRLLIDPVYLAMPIFSVDSLPFYWKQWRSSIGLAWRFGD